MAVPTRPQKITLAETRAANVRNLLIYCSDYHFSHWTTISGDRWPDHVRLSDLEPRFTCYACGRRGADVRPNWQSVEAYAPDTEPAPRLYINFSKVSKMDHRQDRRGSMVVHHHVTRVTW